jgi:glucokinase
MPARRTIGVDLGGTKLLAGAVDLGFRVHHRAQRTVTGLDQKTLLDVTVDAVQQVRESAGGEVEAVGFGIPCLIDRRTGMAASSVHLPLADIPFADVMAERLGMPVFIDNDGNTAALAEHRAGAARGVADALVMTLGTGIAGGLILRGELYRGATGFAGEFGHMTIEMDGPLHDGDCPNRGCVEAYASGAALAREARRLAFEHPGSGLARAARQGREIAGPLVTELAHDGDPAAIEAIELIGTRLGVALAGLVNTFNPEVVVIGGGVLAAGELLLTPARAEMVRRALAPPRDFARIVPARFGVDAGMIGAATLAFDGLAAGEEARA